VTNNPERTLLPFGTKLGFQVETAERQLTQFGLCEVVAANSLINNQLALQLLMSAHGKCIGSPPPDTSGYPRRGRRIGLEWLRVISARILNRYHI